MKSSIFGIFTLIFALALSLTACDDGNGTTHTHDYGTAWQNSATEHWHECTANDGAKTDIAAHTAGNWVIDTPATATTAGSQHKECTVCGYVLETETIPATHTHTYAAAWSKDATQHWRECTANDGAKTDIAPHQWQWEETTPATTQAPGQETETCATCGATSGNTRPIAQLPDPNPKDQSKTITFGTDLATTVTGHMTDTQWDNVMSKLTIALEAAANSSDVNIAFYCTTLFGGMGVNIDLIENPAEGYSYYKMDGDALKIFLNADYAIGAAQADLSEKVAVALNSLSGGTPTQQ